MTSPTNLLQLADDYAHAKTYFKDQGSEVRKRLQAAIIVAETDALKAEQKAVADEREACAAIAENGPTPNPDIASAIRARARVRVRSMSTDLTHLSDILF